jgi:hypothetical protein
MKFLMIVCADESNPVAWNEADFEPWLTDIQERLTASASSRRSTSAAVL